jgi:choline dehydrogenase-like flavoprotein
MAELGVFTSYDGASGDSVGSYFTTHTQDPSNATRSTARTAYYNPFVSRPSLHLLTSRQVTRVITESTHYGPKVTGVEVIIIFPPIYLNSVANLVTDQFAESSIAPRVTVDVDMEAILAAGSIHSPQILQLSGIGEPALLEQHNISTVANVPGVGRNLQDHPLLYVDYQCMDCPSFPRRPRMPV